MALDIKDGTGASKTVKTTESGGEHTPHHIKETPSLTSFRSLSVASTAVSVKSSAGELWGFNIINLHTSDIYVKFYNIAAGSVNPASDVPVLTLLVPASGAVFVEPGCRLHAFTTQIAIRAVTGSGDSNTTAPSTSPIIELKYL